MAEKEYFGPLTLHQNAKKMSIFKSDESYESVCLLCDEKFTLLEEEQKMLTHFFMAHRLVIADVNQIADMNGYLTYWRLRFKDEGLPFFCTTMFLDDKPDGTKSKNEEYFLLSDVLPEEKQLRSNLQHTRLEKLLEQHQFEREDINFDRECLFCRYHQKDSRSNYLKHLYEKHNFHIAKPENLIFIDDLIAMIATKLEKLQCIFCEKFFKDRTILKEHMRKKAHKRINPDNKEYDKYFLVNYLGEKHGGYNQQKKRFIKKPTSMDNDTNTVDSDPDWSDWTEENSSQITCLLCNHVENEYDNILDHMERKHDFSFTDMTSGLTFYNKIKIVNFIRRKVHLKQCLSCELKFEDATALLQHMELEKHLVLLKSSWDQPEYYFPTYEDDLFLCFVQDEEELWCSGDERETERRNSMSEAVSKEMALAIIED